MALWAFPGVLPAWHPILTRNPGRHAAQFAPASPRDILTPAYVVLSIFPRAACYSITKINKLYVAQPQFIICLAQFIAFCLAPVRSAGELCLVFQLVVSCYMERGVKVLS